ncbi:MAG: EamA family transporter [Acidisphaera sp.]|nr:EamA family transporter [Acidisphaera sp.]
MQRAKESGPKGAGGDSGRFGWRVALALLATYVCFGSGTVGIKAVLDSLPPLVAMASRGVLAGAVLFAWSIWSGAPWPSWRQALACSGIGTLMLALGAGVSTVGQRTVAAGLAGVLAATMPLFAACIGYLLFREQFSKRTLFGLLLGFAGVGLLLHSAGDFNLLGVSLVVAGQFFWALGAVLAPKLGLPDDPRLTAGAELLGGGIVLLIAATIRGEVAGLHLAAVSLMSWMGFAWLAITAIVGFTAYGFLVTAVATSISSTFSYVNPIVAVGLGWLLFSEPVSFWTVAATAVVVAGVCLIVSAGSESRPAHHPLTSGHRHGRAHFPAPALPREEAQPP